MDERHARWWWYLGIPAGVAVGAILAIGLRTSGDERLTLRQGERVPQTLSVHLDRPATGEPAAMAGRYLVVAFGYTSCPDLCPSTLLAVHESLRALGADATRVVPVFVTVDPARDTPDRLPAYVAGFDPRIRSVSDPAAAAVLLRAFRARAEKRPFPSGGGYAMDHTAVVYVLNPAQQVVAVLPEATPTAALIADLVAALRKDPGFAPLGGP